MADTKEDARPTPAGGVRSVIHYQDAEGNPADESVAVRAEIIEYDAHGNEIARTYGTINRGDS